MSIHTFLDHGVVPSCNGEPGKGLIYRDFERGMKEA